MVVQFCNKVTSDRKGSVQPQCCGSLKESNTRTVSSGFDGRVSHSESKLETVPDVLRVVEATGPLEDDDDDDDDEGIVVVQGLVTVFPFVSMSLSISISLSLSLALGVSAIDRSRHL